MRQFKRLVLWVLLILVCSKGASAADTAAGYYGGTLQAFKGAAELVEGTLATDNQDALVFAPTKKKWVRDVVRIPYLGIETIHYERKPIAKMGKRSIAGFALAGALGAGLMADTAYQHLVTVRYTDENGKSELAILELDPATAAGVIADIEKRSGKQRIEQNSAPAIQETRQTAAEDALGVAPSPSAPPAGTSPVIANGDVVKMTKAGIGDDVIVLRIKTARPAFDTSVDALVALKAAGVSDQVIAAMLRSTTPSGR